MQQRSKARRVLTVESIKHMAHPVKTAGSKKTGPSEMITSSIYEQISRLWFNRLSEVGRAVLLGVILGVERVLGNRRSSGKVSSIPTA